MALRDLEVEEMLNVSEPWVDPGRDLPLLEGDELLAGATIAVVGAHERLVGMQKQVGTVEKEVRSLTEELTELDAHHDSKARGIYKALEAGVDLAETPEQAGRYTDAIALLFPQGLTITLKSYRAQAGSALKIQEQITDEDREFLEKVVYEGRPLLDHVEDWFATGLLLGRRVDERARLMGDSDDEAITAGDLRQARLGWIKATNALLTMLELADMDEEKQKDLLANLRQAEAIAAERRRKEQEGEATDTEDADTPDVPEPV